MRATWLMLAAATACLWVSGLSGAEKDGPQRAANPSGAGSRGPSGAEKDGPQPLADRIFTNSDKNKDSSLDEKELLQAKRLLKTALLQGKKAEELPGGKATFDRIQEAAVKGKLGDEKNGAVAKEQWLEHVKDAFTNKEAVFKDVYDRAAEAAKKFSEQQQRERQNYQKRIGEQQRDLRKIQPGKR